MEYKQGPICQSCSMPMDNPECFGTDERGLKVDYYCCHCFYNGEFTNPDITLEEMIDLAVSIMAENVKMSEKQARQISESFIPTLNRWKK